VGVVGAGAGVPGVYIEQVEGVRRELEEVEAAVAGVLDVC
jgi:phage tail sheath protein FI